jgi:hypothetical protein
VARRRGVEVLTGQSIAKAMDGYVELTTGEKAPTCSLIWCVGVRADPLVDGLDLPTNRGRLVVDEYMAATAHFDAHGERRPDVRLAELRLARTAQLPLSRLCKAFRRELRIPRRPSSHAGWRSCWPAARPV